MGDFAGRRNPQRLPLDALASAAQDAALSGVHQTGEAPLELPVDHVTHGTLLSSRQLGDDFYLNQEPWIHQALHLHPGGGGQAFLVVELEAQIRGLQ